MLATATQTHVRTDGELYDSAMTRERIVSAQWVRENMKEFIDGAARGDRMVVMRRSSADMIGVSRDFYLRACEALGFDTTIEK